MSWTFAEERPVCWEEPPEQIAITNVETGEHDFYVLASSATIYGMTWKEIKRKVGEMASMENDLHQAQASRDYWKSMYEGFARDVAERYVKLPADANGVTIQPGARVTHDGKTWAVRTLMLTDEREWLLDCQPEDGEPPAGRTVKPELCIATYQRTVEDVLREVVTLCHNTWKDESAFRSCDVDDVMGSGNIADFADKIRQMLDD